MAARAGGVLALDLSARTGWAYGHDHEAPAAHGVWKLGDTSSLGARASLLAGGLQDAIMLLQPRLVILEAPLPLPAQNHMTSARSQLGLAVVAEMVCHEQAVPAEEASAQDARKLVLGKSRGWDKDAILAWCKREGWAPVDHNDADAMVLLRYRLILGRMRVMA